MPEFDQLSPSAADADGATRLLLIDDDRKLCRLITDYLEPLGYRVDLAHTGPEGLERATSDEFAAIILDVMLPGMDGFEVLKGLRRHSEVPVLMLTSRGDEADRIVGLEIGADDYLPKTFSTRELLARLRAVTRRSRPTASTGPAVGEGKATEELTAGNLRVNTASHTAALGDTPLSLTPIEFALLAALMRARGRVKSREQLVEEIANRDFDIFDRSIDVHISALRKKLGDDSKSPRFIRTVRAVGYMFLDA
ncbi:MAG: response regulator transcription factor [Verrucomicrobiales bacterium]